MKKNLVITLLAGVLGFVLSSSASAQTTVVVNWSYGFENAPTGHFRTIGTAGFDIGAGFARTGANNGWIRASSGWNELRNNVTVANIPAMRQGTCIASAWVRSSGNVTNFYFSALRELDESIYSETGPLSYASLGNWPNYKLIQWSFSAASTSALRLRLRLGFWGNGSDAWVQVDDVSIICDRKS